MASITDRCPTCGLDPRTVNPPDAVAALRSYPRRYRALLVRPDDEEGAEIVRRRPEGGGWSALEHAAHTAEVLDLVAEAFRAVRVQDQPDVEIEPGAPRPGTVDEVVESLAAGAERLAAMVGELSGDDWERTGRLGGRDTVTPLDLLRHAVHVGAHHRREVERVLRQVR